MGSWNESCAVSGAPLEPDSEIVLVGITYAAQEWFCDQYGYISPVHFLEAHQYAPELFIVKHGDYNDYGGITGFDVFGYDNQGRPNVLVYCLVRKEVWDLIQQWNDWPSGIGAHHNKPGECFFMDEFRRFFHFCKIVRITPCMQCGASFTGHQMVEDSELRARLALNAVSNEITMSYIHARQAKPPQEYGVHWDEEKYEAVKKWFGGNNLDPSMMNALDHL